jgi:hypothetical protein
MRYPSSPYGSVGFGASGSPGGIFGTAEVVTLTVAGVAVKSAGSESKNLQLDTFGGAATQDLTAITGFAEGDMLLITPYNGTHTIVVKAGAPLCLQGIDFSMNDVCDTMVLLNVGTDIWRELSRSANSL